MANAERIPLSTYRLQFNGEFTFSDAAELVPYLHRLGVSHCYASPYLKARAGSSHGYDIVDHNALNPEIGDAESFDRFTEALAAHHMGHILDLVPNHMGIFSHDNEWWLDVLENGPASAYAGYFDIEWRPTKEVLRGKVLLPLLGDHYGGVLEEGQLSLAFDAERGDFSVWYWDHRFPIDPATYPTILEYGLDAFLAGRGADDPDGQDLQALITSFGHLPARWDQSEESLTERRRDKEVHKRHLSELAARSPEVRRHIEAAVEACNGVRGDPASFDSLHRLLEQQAYRPAFWKVASDDINYRRFFDINDLAGLRQEQAEVFANTHRLILQLLHEDRLQGVRIDHPDGLYDPAGYYQQLNTAGRNALANGRAGDGDRTPPFYLVVEKILASHEHLPEHWPVHGTTGYDYANLVSGLFVYPESEHELTRLYSRFTGLRDDFDQLLFERKKLVIETQLSSELGVLANMLDQIAQQHRHTRDFTLNGLREALSMVVANFPVYRTYINGTRPIPEEDHRHIEWAVARAKKYRPAADITIFDFLQDILLAQGVADDPKTAAYARAFTMKFQQYTAPVMAKGLEDTAFYVYNRLVSLNEVGGDPRRFGVSTAAFHHTNQERLLHWPHAMLATSTHDTKRSEDVRARINVLSEIPGEWQRHVGRWSRLNRTKKLVIDDRPAPSRNDEYLLYQTLVGAWPLEPMDEEAMARFRERIGEYMFKAVREAKVYTSWINPNTDYEEAVRHFVHILLSDPNNRFVTDLLPFAERVARCGLFSSLSQAALKFTSPGVPDLYQGSELWAFALVDPDNRHPVDYGKRGQWLAELEASPIDRGLARSLTANMEDGRIKLFLTWRLLQLRRRHPRLFQYGSYQPLTVTGRRADHLCAFARQDGEQAFYVVAPRWFARLLIASDLPFGTEVWGDTAVEWPHAGSFQNVFTGEIVHVEGPEIPATELFTDFPVAVLIREPAETS